MGIYLKFSVEWEFNHTDKYTLFSIKCDIERTIQTVKNLVKKCNIDENDMFLALSEYFIIRLQAVS